MLFESIIKDEHTEWTELENLTKIQNGFAFKSKEYLDTSKTPIIRTLNIGSDHLFDNENMKYISDDSREKYYKFQFKAFDTALVMVGASIGKIGFITSKNDGGLQNQNMWRFRPLDKNIPGLYMFNLVRYANTQMQGFKTGSAREFYTKDAFKKLKVPKCSNEKYSSFFILQNLIDSLAVQTSVLKKIRDELIKNILS